MAFMLIFLIFVAEPAQSADKENLPPITDHANLLTSNQVSELDMLISNHNQSSPEKIRLIVIPRLPPNTKIEDYSKTILQKDISSSGASPYRIQFIVAMDNRKFIIDTTPSVRTVLTDDFIHKIIGNTIAPQFREKQFFSGIKIGLITIIAKLNDGRRVMENSTAKITKLSCSNGGCVAAIESTGRHIMLMWGSLTSNTEDGFMVVRVDEDGKAGYGHEYSLISAKGNTLEIGVTESSDSSEKKTVKKDSKRQAIIATKDKNGVYSFIPLELIGIGKIVMKKSPIEPSKFLVGGPTLDP